MNPIRSLAFGGAGSVTGHAFRTGTACPAP